jgi:hypothetical protein
VWGKPDLLAFGNVTTVGIVVPNRPELFGRWEGWTVVDGTHMVGGDYAFLRSTCELMGAPKWVDQVTARTRPDVPRQASAA